jgi:DNA replication and repair protein RecF
MLRLEKISITQFRNYSLSSFEFHERVLGICGLNGKGKTNLLDAIWFCCFAKSYFAQTDMQVIQFGQEGFRLEARFENDGEPQNVIYINRGNGKKELLFNNIPYTKLSQHIGRIPAVMVAPDDIELVTGSSEIRRRFMDTVISQLDNVYLQQLIQYNKILQQRNSLLKRFADQGNKDMALLEVLNEQLSVPAAMIHQKRNSFCVQLVPLVQQYYQQISQHQENVSLLYESKLNETDLPTLLEQSLEKDMILQRTNNGIHRDDIYVQLNEQPFRTTASQGQRKSLLFALKLAEFELLKQRNGFPPILLLDDVFEKLDDNRMNQLLHWVCVENNGQVFITDTHRNRLEEVFQELKVPYQIIEL